MDLLLFLIPFLRSADLSEPIRVLYRGTIRLFLVLLHDFPDFLADLHASFCDAIAANCVQLRNIVLSAYPRSMRLPDPFNPLLKVDALVEVSHPPRILSPYTAVFQEAPFVSFFKELEANLRSQRVNPQFMIQMRELLYTPSSTPLPVAVNVRLLNAIVLHVGMHAVSIGLGKGAPVVPVASPHVDIFANLAFRLLDEEGQYVLVNAIANQLRYPNAHTHYFSCLLINLFGESRDECLKELITRCLLERLIVHRPQPWGLLVTFVELIKNPRYQFWQQPFVSCAEEIERLLTNLARNCLRAQGGKAEKV